MPSWWEQLWDQVAGDYLRRMGIEQWAAVVRHALDSLLLVAVTIALIWLARQLIMRVLCRVGRVRRAVYLRKVETMGLLVFSIIKYALIISCGIWVLSIWGVNTEGLIVGSAVLGAAIGFGSQGLVQDVITGLSLLAEEQLEVGDFVEMAGRSGAVEEVGLRVVKLRDMLGVQHVIFNRNISLLSNYGGTALVAFVDVALESRAAAEQAREVVQKAGAELADELPYFLGPPEVLGIIETCTREFFLRLRVRVLPQQGDAIRAHLAGRLQRALADAGLKVPEGQVRYFFVSEQFREIVEKAGSALTLVRTKTAG